MNPMLLNKYREDENCALLFQILDSAEELGDRQLYRDTYDIIYTIAEKDYEAGERSLVFTLFKTTGETDFSEENIEKYVRFFREIETDLDKKSFLKKEWPKKYEALLYVDIQISKPRGF